MKLFPTISLLCFLTVALAGAAETPEPKKAKYVPKPGMVLFICQPNGWGQTPAQAYRDLDYVMGLYKDRPGFHRDNYGALIQISKNMYQVDGRCTFYAYPVKQAGNSRHHPPNVARGPISRKGS